ncbi:GatB/YqeY domain-containing protein [Lactobacillaceae bacterium L1_55_11]|nr:GatB/YqeY domain-containing protein [Lactobacillaceae bacterium L1_55_11]
MSLLTDLQNDMKTAMKAQDKETLAVIRMLKSAVMNEQIKLNHDLSENEELAVLSREAKQRKESLQEFKEANRPDLMENLEKELKVLDRYLPAQLKPEEITTIIEMAIQQTGAQSPKDMGKVMGVVTPQIKGRADGKLVADEVKKLLASK